MLARLFDAFVLFGVMFAVFFRFVCLNMFGCLVFFVGVAVSIICCLGCVSCCFVCVVFFVLVLFVLFLLVLVVVVVCLFVVCLLLLLCVVVLFACFVRATMFSV